MPIMKMIKTGLSAAEMRKLVGSSSPLKYGGTFIDHHGTETELSGAEADLMKHINELAGPCEKATLFVLKESGYDANIRHSPKEKDGLPAEEWDHFILSFTKEETAALSPEDQDKIRRAVIDRLTVPVNMPPKIAPGHRAVFITHGHDDTGNWHLHVVVHRHVVNHAARTASKAWILAKPSEASLQYQELNDALQTQCGIKIRDFVSEVDNTYVSAFKDKNYPEEVKSEVTRMVEESGGQPSLDLQPAQSPSAGREEYGNRPALSPDASLVEQFIRDQERVALGKQKEAQHAAMQVAVGQHALAAITRAERAEAAQEQLSQQLDITKKERDELDLRVSTLEKDHQALSEQHSETAQALDGLIQKTNKTQKVLDSMADIIPGDIPEHAGRVSWLATSFLKTQEELNERQQELAGMKDMVGQLQKSVSSLEERIGGIDSTLAPHISLMPKKVAGADVEQKVAWLTSELPVRLQQIDELSGHLKREQETLAEREVQLTKITETAAHLETLSKDQRSLIDQQSKQLEQTIKTFEQQSKQLEQTVESFEQRVTVLQDSNAKLTKDLGFLRAENDALRQKVEKTAAPGKPAVSDKDRELIKKQVTKEQAKKQQKPKPKK